MSKRQYQKGQITQFSQDGSREFISLLACACADGTTTPPALIYQGTSNDLQSSWVDDLQEGEEAYFTSSENGWTCNALGIAWLRKFHKDTVKKARNRRRLLIIDGHSSHINWEFITLADSLNILILIMPPHTTHRLQPLDVGLFGPLQQSYCRHLDEFSFDGLGWVSMTKRMFWSVFKKAWKDSFTEKNIKSAFKKTGIWPLKKEIVISQLPTVIKAPQTPSRLPSLAIRTPTTVRTLRRLLKTSPSRTKLSLLERAVMRLATENEITKHENRGLRRAIVTEKTRRKRGGRLNLMGEVAGTAPQFFSPQKVIAARTYQDGKEARAEEEKRLKAQKKEEAAHQRQKKANDKLEAQIQRQLLQKTNREAKAAEKAQKQAQQQELRAQKALEKQAAATAAAQRKKEQTFEQQTVAATKKAAASKESKRPAPKVASITGKKAIPKTTKPSKSSKSSSQRAPNSKKADSEPAAATTAATATAAGSRSRSGRNVVKPQRFQE